MNRIFTSLKNFFIKFTFILIIILIGQNGYSQCNHTISLFDSYGDGWNGATVTVRVNGVAVLTNITLASGSGPANFTFSASTGDAIQVVVTASGGYLDECYFDVKDVNNDLLVNDWYPYFDGNTWNGTANCAVIMKVPSTGNNSYTTCSGNLYDFGGPSGNYGNSWNGYTVLYPTVGTDKVRISGTTSGESCCDYVRIYDGVGTGGTVLGTYYMNTAIPTLTSTDATGALTVRFVSDGSSTGSGFNISISCFTPCATVAGTSSSSITNSCGSTSTTLSLAGEGAGSIQWQQSTDGGTTWNNIAGANTDPYVHTTSVSRMYRAAVTNGCTSYSTTSSISIDCNIIHPSSGTTSTTIQCGAGTYTYYDPGYTGNYSDGQLGTLTINPSSVGQMVQINFGAGAWDVEDCSGAGCDCDWIKIYNGTNTSAPLLGTYCNGNAPGVITSTTGSLTIVFDSDGGTVGSGWVASVTCFTPCAVVAGTSSSSITTGCGSTATTLSLAGEGAGAIQWQQSTDGGATWANIAGATTDPYVHTTSVTTMYRAAVTSGCTSYSTTSTLTISCVIIHPASGFASSTINCGASYTYRDPGNTSNYGDDQNGLITICPSVAGRYVNVNFTSFNIESGYDYIYVFDGDWEGAPILGVYSGNGALSGNVRATASNTSGCLSFRFYSDGATTELGWQATVTCNATPSATVPSSNPEDCQGAITVCSNSSLVGGTNNYGFDELPDLWNSCLGNSGQRGEYESTWYVFSPATSGTVGFAITPASPADYDWAIWGPYTSLSCPAYTNDTPIRCSSTSLAGTGGGGVTGLIAPATDVIEQNGEYGGGSNENGKLKPIDVLAGEVYVMMLDNWDANTTTFSLNWTLTNGASLDCTPPLPITLSYMQNSCEDGRTLIEWNTTSEQNNDYFAIEKSDENFNFIEIGRVLGSGNSNVNQSYAFTDPTFNEKTTYYRIKQVDYNGEHTYYRVLASNCYNPAFEVVNTSLSNTSLDFIINSFEKEYITVYLYDIHGKLVAEEKRNLTVGNNKLNISSLNISSGIYMINIVGEVHQYQTKVLRR